MAEFRKRYRVPLIVGGLLLLALLVFSDNLRQKEQTSFFERTVLKVTAPFQRGLSALQRGVKGVWDHYFYLVDVAEENELLLEENRRLRAQLDSLAEVPLANERLRELLGFREEIGLEALPAQVIAEDSSGWFQTVILDKGSEDGVREGMAVVVPEGVVGRIIKCASSQARVLLITDASSAAASLIQRTRSRGISRGRGDRLTFEFALRQEDIEVGDRVITSGMGGVFSKGLLVGEVSRVVRGEYGLFQTVEVAPAADFSKLEEVLILLERSE